MGVVNGIVKFILKDRMEDIENFTNNPLGTQEKIFFNLIQHGTNTEWGKLHGYESISSIKEFQERVPVNTYEDMEPFIDRILRGEQNILWDTPIKWLAKSSGTTSNKSKFIPVSEESLEDCHYKAGKDIMAIYCHNNPETKIYSSGKGLIIGGSHEISQHSNDIAFGDLSAVLLQNLPFMARYFRTPSLNIALMNEWEMKLELMAKETMNENVTFFSGVPSWSIVLIKKLFELTGKDNLLDIWPNLELFMHGGMNFGPYKEQFKKYIPSDQMSYYETYNASEGFFAFQNEEGTDDMLLLTNNGIFYEFIPLNQLDNDHPKALTLDEVEVGVNYAILISTNAGLWRYMVGDTVCFTSKHPFKIQVTGRTKHFINSVGEEVIINNAEFALTKASAVTEAVIKEYSAAPVYVSDEQAGCHEWLIEFEQAPNDMDLFSKVLDDSLQEANSDYKAKRYNDYALRFPMIKVVKEGTFYSWMKHKGKLGGQHKVPRLSNNRDFIDEILEFAEA